jgi:YozE SAM-like protein
MKEPMHHLETPNASLIGFILEHRADSGPFGTFARSISRDPCWPAHDASYVECVAHIIAVHGGDPAAIDTLSQLWAKWRDRWLQTGTYPSGPPISTFSPRQPILEAALDSGPNVSRNHMAFCWNDEPGTPTRGHFNGNRERSLKLYADNDTFECHQCGIWGYSDQLKTRTWQDRKQ